MLLFIAIITVWAFFVALTSPAPTPRDGLGLVQPPSPNHGDPVKSRISLVLTSKLCLCLLSGLFGAHCFQVHPPEAKHTD